ncbi:MAG: HI1506-related protein [Pseudomonadota bacterium]
MSQAAFLVSADRDGWRRCGRAWTREPQVVAEGSFGEDEWRRLRADPRMTVAATGEGEAPAAPGSTEPASSAPGSKGPAPAKPAPAAPGPAAPEPAEPAVPQLAAIVDAIRELPTDAFTQGGAPRVDAIEAVLKQNVTSAERDAAWAALKAEQGPAGVNA